MIETRRPVFMCGENPGLTLFVPDTDRIAAVASYWHCTDSPWGAGHALVLWTRDPDAEARGILTDNLPLAKRLVEELTCHFPEFRDIPVVDLPYVAGACSHTFDGAWYRVVCLFGTRRIEVEWSGMLDRKQIVWPGFPAGPVAFDLTTVIRPCASAGIRVDGRPIAGEVRTETSREGHPSSSAFLAFAETWIGPLSPSS